MGDIIDMLTGAGGRRADAAANAAQAERLSQQRRNLAQLAAETAQIDQASATGGQRRRGRRLLTFLTGTGQATLG